MERLLESCIKSTRENIEKSEELVLKNLGRKMTEDDVNHYARVFGFDKDIYTAEEKYLLAINRFLYWTVVDEDDEAEAE